MDKNNSFRCCKWTLVAANSAVIAFGLAGFLLGLVQPTVFNISGSQVSLVSVIIIIIALVGLLGALREHTVLLLIYAFAILAMFLFRLTYWITIQLHQSGRFMLDASASVTLLSSLAKLFLIIFAILEALTIHNSLPLTKEKFQLLKAKWAARKKESKAAKELKAVKIKSKPKKVIKNGYHESIYNTTQDTIYGSHRRRSPNHRSSSNGHASHHNHSATYGSTRAKKYLATNGVEYTPSPNTSHSSGNNNNNNNPLNTTKSDNSQRSTSPYPLGDTIDSRHTQKQQQSQQSHHQLGQKPSKPLPIPVSRSSKNSYSSNNYYHFNSPSPSTPTLLDNIKLQQSDSLPRLNYQTKFKWPGMVEPSTAASTNSARPTNKSSTLPVPAPRNHSSMSNYTNQSSLYSSVTSITTTTGPTTITQTSSKYQAYTVPPPQPETSKYQSGFTPTSELLKSVNTSSLQSKPLSSLRVSPTPPPTSRSIFTITTTGQVSSSSYTPSYSYGKPSSATSYSTLRSPVLPSPLTTSSYQSVYSSRPPTTTGYTSTLSRTSPIPPKTTSYSYTTTSTLKRTSPIPVISQLVPPINTALLSSTSYKPAASIASTSSTTGYRSVLSRSSPTPSPQVTSAYLPALHRSTSPIAPKQAGLTSSSPLPSSVPKSSSTTLSRTTLTPITSTQTNSLLSSAKSNAILDRYTARTNFFASYLSPSTTTTAKMSSSTTQSSSSITPTPPVPSSSSTPNYMQLTLSKPQSSTSSGYTRPLLASSSPPVSTITPTPPPPHQSTLVNMGHPSGHQRSYEEYVKSYRYPGTSSTEYSQVVAAPPATTLMMSASSMMATTAVPMHHQHRQPQQQPFMQMQHNQMNMIINGGGRQPVDLSSTALASTMATRTRITSSTTTEHHRREHEQQHAIYYQQIIHET